MEKDVNDLVISPASQHVLASCSADYSIRVWNLDPRYHKQPCAAILSGEGHRQAILSIVCGPTHALYTNLTGSAGFPRKR